MTSKETPQKKKKPFLPEHGNMRNLLTSLEDILGSENHYLEFAAEAKSPEKRRQFLKMMDDARRIRQRLALAVDWNTETWCNLKHSLHAISNLREVIEKSYRQGMDIEEVLGSFNQLAELITRQVELMSKGGEDKGGEDHGR